MSSVSVTLPFSPVDASAEAVDGHAARIVVPPPGELSTARVPATRSRRSLHDAQAHVAAAGDGVRVEPPAVVLHGERGAAVPGEHARAHARGARVLGDVAERLLRHAVEDDLDVRRQVQRRVDLDVHDDVGLPGERVAEALEQRVQRRRLECRRPELEQQRAHLRQRGADEPAQALQVVRALGRVALPHGRQRLGDQRGAVDALGHGVVQVARQRLALLGGRLPLSPGGTGGRSR